MKLSPSLKTLLACLAISSLAAASATAGTIYVSTPGSIAETPVSTQILVTNSVAGAKAGKWLTLNQDTDGTVRPPNPTAFSVAGRQTIVLDTNNGFLGLVELTSTPEVFFSAHVVAPSGALVAAPVISSTNAAGAAEKVALPGLARTATSFSDLVIVNLDRSAASCTVSFNNAQGGTLAAAATVTVKPLSMRRFADALASFVSGPGLTEVSALVSCNKAFYVHGWLTDTATSTVRPILVGGSGASALVAPGDEAACPAGATCLKVDGLLHQPTTGKPVGRVSLATPTGTFRRIRMSLEVTVDNFFAGDPDGKHLIYWFVINKNLDMPGMLYFRGPDSFTALVRHGINAPHADKKKITAPFEAKKGHTYRVVNDYDMGKGSYTITITDLGDNSVKTIQGTPNVGQFTFKSTDRFIIDMGFPENVVADEVPTYNWIYRNLKIDVIP